MSRITASSSRLGQWQQYILFLLPAGDEEHEVLQTGSIYLLPSGSEQKEVLRVVSIPSRILLYCRQSSRSFISLVEALVL